MKNRAINDAFLEIFSFNPHAFWLQALEANSNNLIRTKLQLFFLDFASITLLYFIDKGYRYFYEFKTTFSFIYYYFYIIFSAGRALGISDWCSLFQPPCFQHLDFQAFGLSSFWPFRPLGFWAFRPLGFQAFRPSDFLDFRPLGFRAFRPLGFQAIWLLGL